MCATPGRIRKRVWVQNVAVQTAVLDAKLAAAAQRDSLTAAGRQLLQRVQPLLTAAKEAAFHDNPVPGRRAMWWRGTPIEAAYQHQHAAEALAASRNDQTEVDAEIPDAVGRVDTCLSVSDPRRVKAHELLASASDTQVHGEQPNHATVAHLRQRLRKTLEVGYAHRSPGVLAGEQNIPRRRPRIDLRIDPT